MRNALKTVTLVGRPNCGKSSIWNRLVRSESEARAGGRSKAKRDSSFLTGIVSGTAGTTRDVREGYAALGDLRFKLVDTGGFEESFSKRDGAERAVTEAMMARTAEQLRVTDVILLCLDATVGVSPEDEHFARWLRKQLPGRRTALTGAETRSEATAAASTEMTAAKEERTTTPNPRVVVVANKIDAAERLMINNENTPFAWGAFLEDCARLGFGNPVPFSARPREQGLGELHTALSEALEEDISTPSSSSLALLNEDQGGAKPAGESRTVRLTVLGKPNAGKSTLLNAVLGRERFVVSELAGTTRDTVWHDVRIPHTPPRDGEEVGGETSRGWTTVRLIDTAGISRRAMRAPSRAHGAGADFNTAREGERAVEAAAVEKSIAAIRAADVVALVLDLSELDHHAGDKSKPPSISRHDLALAGRVADEGKPLMILANKLDRIAVLEPSAEKESELNATGERKLREWVRGEFRARVPSLKEAPVLLVSATTGRNLDRVLPTVLELDSRWTRRISTSRLNRWLQLATGEASPPLANVVRFFGNRRTPGVAPVRLKFMTQVSARPPTFAVWCNRPGELAESYRTYLQNRLRTDFGFQGVPVRLLVRSSENPYAGLPKTSPSSTPRRTALGLGGERKRKAMISEEGSRGSRRRSIGG